MISNEVNFNVYPLIESNKQNIGWVKLKEEPNILAGQTKTIMSINRKNLICVISTVEVEKVSGSYSLS